MLPRPIYRLAQVSRQIIPQARLIQPPHFTRFNSTSYTRGFATMAPIPKTMKAARVNKQGGVEELEVVEIPVPTPKPEEIVIKTEWAGVNFIDTYFRGGVYPRQTPFTLGQEAAGTIVALPSSADVLDSNDYKIRGFSEGLKVAALASGGFAEYVAVPWTHVQTLPEGADTRQGAVSLLQGLTALTFVKEAYPIQKGDWILIHAAAGGVGLLLVQLASQFGATVIGTTSSQAKAEIAKKAGATHIINYTESSVPDEVLKLTNGDVALKRSSTGWVPRLGRTTSPPSVARAQLSASGTPVALYRPSRCSSLALRTSKCAGPSSTTTSLKQPSSTSMPPNCSILSRTENSPALFIPNILSLLKECAKLMWILRDAARPGNLW
ncbi:hypothetical protein RSAG8_08932, partial [Rhizoctonia solani AG-8 WAC10335]